MSKGTIALVAGFLAVALVAAGCGSGSDGDSEITTSSLSKAEFIKKADAACTKGNKKVSADFTTFIEKTHFKVNEKPNEEQVNGLVHLVMAPAVKREIAYIRAIGAPSGDEDRIEAILAALEEALETAEKNPRIVAENSAVAFGIATRLAKEYGLGVCAVR